jgi:alpha-1,3-mannosyltransferase
VGAYLDFTAGAIARAPLWLRQLRLEWLFRLVQEPKRLCRRYIVGNATFLAYMLWLAVLGRFVKWRT